MMIYVYGTQDCPYCDKAKDLLDANKLDYRYYDVSEDTAARAELKRRGLATVPQIFKHAGNGHMAHWGGYTDLKARMK